MHYELVVLAGQLAFLKGLQVDPITWSTCHIQRSLMLEALSYRHPKMQLFLHNKGLLIEQMHIPIVTSSHNVLRQHNDTSNTILVIGILFLNFKPLAKLDQIAIPDSE